MINPSLKTELIHELKPQLSNIDLSSCLDLFWEIINLPTNQKELQGINIRFPEAIENIFNINSSHATVINCMSTFFKIEPLFKLFLYIIDKETYYVINNRKGGLAIVLKSLNLVSDDVNLIKPSTYYKGCDNYLEQIVQAYQLRNTEAHNCEAWGRRELYNNIDAVLISIIYFIHRNKALLLKKLDEIKIQNIDVSPYMKELITYFKNKMKKFIMLNGEENLKVMDRYIVEEIEAENDDDETGRHGQIDYLRNTCIPEKRMIIWGEAGTGKSTILEYLAYVDAKKQLTDHSECIPVLIPLGILTSKSDSIIGYIKKKININDSQVELLLQNGRINLFLDGINEIPTEDNYDLKSYRIKEIKSILNEYKNCFVIITNRPNLNNDFKGSPVFNLLKLNDEQLSLFLEKNTKSSNTIKIISTSINQNNRLKNIIRTPLMFTCLIDIVDETGIIPSSEGEIIGAFLDILLNREKIEKMNYVIDIKKIKYLLRAIAYNGLEDYSTNAGIPEEKILQYMKNCMETYSFKVDAFTILEQLNQLGILIQRDNLYLFKHQAYQDYYYALEEMAVLGM